MRDLRLRICRAILELEASDGVATVGAIARHLRRPAPAIRERCHALRRAGDLIGLGTVRLAARPLTELGEIPLVYCAGFGTVVIHGWKWQRHDHPALEDGDPVGRRIAGAIAASSDLVIASDPIAAATPIVVRARRAGVPVLVADGDLDGVVARYLAPPRAPRVG